MTAKHERVYDAEFVGLKRHPPKQTGRPEGRPAKRFRLIGAAQFGTGVFGFGGKAEFTWVPRSRSSAMLSALSSFSSDGT